MFTLFKKKKAFAAPFTGTIQAITDAPDETFSSKTMGDGFVVFPTDNTVYAPADSTVTYIADTHHALCLTTTNGTDYMLHIGIDTVQLAGHGFSMAVTDGQEVKKGDVLMTFDRDYIQEHAKSDACLCVFTNLPEGKEIFLTKTGAIQALEEACTF